MAYRSWPIKQKILVINVATVVCALIVLVALMMAGGYLVSRDRLLAEQQVQARVVALTLGDALRRRDAARVEETLGALRVAPHVVGAVLFAIDGQPIARSVQGDPGAALPEFFDARGGTLYSFGSGTLDVYHPVVVDGAPRAIVAVRSTLQALQHSVGWFAWLAGSIALLLGGIALLIQERLLRRVSTPLRQLASTMWKLSERRDLSVRVQIESDDEVGQLARGFNEMITNLQERDTQLGEELKERKLTERRLHELAHYDTLTGLPNRNYFNGSLARLLREREAYGGKVALLFIDLDNFKLVNDSLGHTMGDKLLAGVAERLRRVLRSGDVLYRLGGDEFTVTLPKVDTREVAEQLSRRILEALAHPFNLDAREVFANASIGVALAPDDGRDADSLVRNADTAMYEAKDAGKNTFRFFNDEMSVSAKRRLSVETSLRRALDRGELELHGQPQIDLGTNQLVGVEALLRWLHPEMGQLAPAEFIPMAEESGLIVPIGEWILFTAAREARSWDRLGLGRVRIAVNLASRQFRDPGLATTVKKVLADTRLDPGRLDLEITEGTLMQSDQPTLDMMDELRSMGVQLTVDDFGTGYSSMSYLKRYPLSGIKIDQSFVRDLPASRDDVAITRAIVAMARTLDLGIVAEGVENERQYAFLSSLGDMVAQGHFFSRPIAFRTLPPLLTRWRRYSLSELLDRGEDRSPELAGVAAE